MQVRENIKRGFQVFVLCTDFGLEGPYLGQMRAVLHRVSPGVPVVDLFADLTPFDPQAAAYLLPAYCRDPFPEGTVFLCIVDPGVGTERDPVVVHADGLWFVGPDNGLFSQIVRRGREVRAWRITWTPAELSASFHGRDLFAPLAGRLYREDSAALERDGSLSPLDSRTLDRDSWPDDLAQVVYIDRYGNLLTGIRAKKSDAVTNCTALIEILGYSLRQAVTFGDVAEGEAFWYTNANGLVELASNRQRADKKLGAEVGTPVSWGRA